jgi:hypothetical protein
VLAGSLLLQQTRPVSVNDLWLPARLAALTSTAVSAATAAAISTAAATTATTVSAATAATTETTALGLRACFVYVECPAV